MSPCGGTLNRFERKSQQAGYDIVIGGDYTVRACMRVVWIGREEIARAAGREHLVELAEKWLEERR